MLPPQAQALSTKAAEVHSHVITLIEGLTGWATRSSGHVNRVTELIARAGGSGRAVTSHSYAGGPEAECAM